MQNKRYLLIDGSINAMAKIMSRLSSLDILITMNSTLSCDTHIYMVDEANTQNALYLGKFLFEKQQDFEKNILLDVMKSKDISPYSFGICLVQNNNVVAQGFTNGTDVKNFGFLQPASVPKPASVPSKTPLASPAACGPQFLDLFESAYGLPFALGTQRELPLQNHCLAMLLQDKSIGDAIARHGYCYYAYQEQDVLILGVPCLIDKEPMPFLRFFKFSSFLKSIKNDKFGCFFIGVNLKKMVIFPVVFE